MNLLLKTARRFYDGAIMQPIVRWNGPKLTMHDVSGGGVALRVFKFKGVYSARISGHTMRTRSRASILRYWLAAC